MLSSECTLDMNSIFSSASSSLSFPLFFLFSLSLFFLLFLSVALPEKLSAISLKMSIFSRALDSSLPYFGSFLLDIEYCSFVLWWFGILSLSVSISIFWAGVWISGVSISKAFGAVLFCFARSISTLILSLVPSSCYLNFFSLTLSYPPLIVQSLVVKTVIYDLTAFCILHFSRSWWYCSKFW